MLLGEVGLLKGRHLARLLAKQLLRASDERIKPLAGHGADGNDGDTQRLECLSDPIDRMCFALFHPDGVDLVSRHDLGPVFQVRVIALQLPVDQGEVLERVPPLRGGGVQHMDHHLGALDVAQKFMTQSGAVGGALDQARDVRDHKALPVPGVDHAQIGGKRCKVIVGDLRLRVGHPGEQRGFAHVWEAHQAHVGDHFQLQHHLQLDGLLPRLRVLGRLHG